MGKISYLSGKQPMRKVFEFLKSVLKSDSPESSKRVMAMYTLLILITYVVFRYTTKENAIMMVTLLGSFVLTLAGYATWQSIKQNK